MQQNEPHLEIERKYLISYPDVNTLLSVEGATKTAITQTYLSAPAGVSRRIRKSEGKETVYTYTEKKKRCVAVREEAEREISESEYFALAKEADPACAPVLKVRVCVPFEGFVWEADLYPFWDKVAVLEVELSDLSQTPTLPPCFCLLKEVTDEPSMTNHSLAKYLKNEKTDALLASVL